MARPNFFIVGAPKCGTTALYTYLRSHPGVFLPASKEPGYFLVGTELDGLTPTGRSPDDYARLFRGASEGQGAVGEATVWYLFAPGAVERIRAFEPGARIIVMVRSHVDYLHALHNQLVYNRDEDVGDFETAWHLSAARRQGREVPPSCRAPAILDYERVGRLGDQLERVLSVFPADQVRTVVFDDLVRDPASAYADVLRFLDLPYDGRMDFPRVNANRTFRFPRIGDFYQTTAMPARKGWASLKRAVGLDQRLPVGKVIHAFLSRAEPRAPVPGGLRREIGATFASDRTKLSDLLGRDLAHWSRE